jgi:hypothetical protein
MRIDPHADGAVLAEEHHSQLGKRRLASALSRWRDNYGRHQNDALQADLILETKIMADSFKIWSTSSRRMAQNVEVADNALRFFAKRSILKCWKAAYEHKRREKWLVEREKKVLKGVMERE